MVIVVAAAAVVLVLVEVALRSRVTKLTVSWVDFKFLAFGMLVSAEPLCRYYAVRQLASV